MDAQIQNTSESTPGDETLNKIGNAAVKGASYSLPVVALVLAVLVMAVLYASIEHLGSKTLIVNSGPVFCEADGEGWLCSIKMPQLVAMSVAGTFLLLLIAVVVLARTRKRRTLLMAGLFAVAWLALAVIMAIVDTAVSQAKIEIPADVLRIGTFVYSALPALPLIPLIALAASAAHEQDDQYASLKVASGAGGMTLLKAFGWVAMFAIEAYYGVTIGVNPIAAVFAGLLNATAFTAALGNIETAEREKDGGGVTMWGVIGAFYALVMFAVAAEAIITFSKDQAEATAAATKTAVDAVAMGKLNALNPPPWLESLAQWAFVSSIGLSALMLVLTFWRKSRRAVKADVVASDGDGTPWLVRQAATVNQARAALRGQPAPAQLPAAALAKDAPVDPDANMRAFTQELVDELRAERAPKANHKAETELVGVVKPGDTKVAALNGQNHNSDDHNKAARRVRRTSAEVDAGRAGGGEPSDTKSGGGN